MCMLERDLAISNSPRKRGEFLCVKEININIIK